MKNISPQNFLSEKERSRNRGVRIYDPFSTPPPPFRSKKKTEEKGLNARNDIPNMGVFRFMYRIQPPPLFSLIVRSHSSTLPPPFPFLSKKSHSAQLPPGWKTSHCRTSLSKKEISPSFLSITIYFSQFPLLSPFSPSTTIPILTPQSPFATPNPHSLLL